MINYPSHIWGEKAYEAWYLRFGSPTNYAARIIEAPELELPFLNDLGDIKDQDIIQLYGLYGSKAVALSQLGSRAYVSDYSESNRKYATELASAAGADVHYIDHQHLTQIELKFDAAFILGKMHYISDLNRFFSLVNELLVDRGKFLIKDYHPVHRIRKWNGHQFVLEGDYFNNTEQAVLPQHYFLGEADRKTLPLVPVRYWNIEDILMALIKNSFTIEKFVEEKGSQQRFLFPSSSETGIEYKQPGSMIIVARKYER